ncbi:sorting nexin 1 [Striga asiatica]|uniref:Sorting nexin 1 n=1 Tax=Striga asiatica TaxID=4170 RepID=A0A5A7QAN8_STRAF|nr:sorting nexin 1 [Striga asiatica]
MITTMNAHQRSGSGPSVQSPRSLSLQTPYLTVSVSDPAKMGNGVQAYISYKVITKLNYLRIAHVVLVDLLRLALGSQTCMATHDDGDVSLDGQVVAKKETFRYLGSMLQKDGGIDVDVRHRIATGWLKWRQASGVFCDKRVPQRLKGKFYKTAIRPTMLYGAECWPTKRKHGRVAPIEEKLVQHQLRLFGHVQRRPPDAPVRRGVLQRVADTNFPEYEGSQKIVIRRYSDFVWLRDRLFEKYKGIFIPPLPEKSTVEKFRFSTEFIEMRRQALDVFVNRIASHHELQKSDDLRIFLQADEQTMDRARFQETGIFKKPADFMQIFKDVQSKVSDVVLGKEKPVEESSPEYEKLKNYIFQLEDHLAEAQKHAYRLVKRHRELGQSLSDFGKAVKLLANCEGNALGKAFSDLGAKSEILSIKLQKEAHHLLMNFEEPLKDYVRAVQSIKATIGERANAFRHHYELAETIKFKEIDMNKLRLTRSEKLAEAEHEYEELKADGAEAARRFDKIVQLMNEEIIRFQEQKTLDMGLAFHEFAKGQARLANSIAEAWRSLLPKIEACSSAQ